MKQLTLFTFTSMTSLFLFAQSVWTDVTRTPGADCNSNKPCYITQDNSTKKFKFTAHYEIKKNKKYLRSISITNEKTGKEAKYDNLKNFQALYLNEKLPLQLVDLNNDGRSDLALNASVSARQGAFFFYWIYDPKTESFVLTNEQIEKLGANIKGQLKGQASASLYKVNSQHKLELKRQKSPKTK